MDLSEINKMSGSLEVNDMNMFVEPHLFKEVKERLKPNLTSVIASNYQTRFLGFKTNELDSEKNGKRMADIVNRACMAFQVVGKLSPTVCITLFDGKMMWATYIGFTNEATSIIDKIDNEHFFKETEMPGNIDEEENEN